MIFGCFFFPTRMCKQQWFGRLPIGRFWTATTQNGSPYYGLTSNGRFPAQVLDSCDFLFESHFYPFWTFLVINFWLLLEDVSSDELHILFVCRHDHPYFQV
jgi:hypothetical protein